MLSIETGIIIWIVGVVLAMLCFIFFWGFEGDDGKTEITGTRVLTYVLMSLIGNWAFVVFYIGLGGIWLITWIGERLEKVFDHTIYESPAPPKKSKKNKTNPSKSKK